jgi:hypothetical protein
LQKQVDFLEQNPEYILCGTDVKRIKPDETESIHQIKNTGEVNLDQILVKNRFVTCTTVFKNPGKDKLRFPNQNKFTVGDWPLWCNLLQYGKGYNLKDVTAQYNIHSGGMVSGRNLSKTLYSKLNDRLEMIHNFPGKKRLIKSYGYKILLHYIKNSLLLKSGYIKALWKNKILILRYLIR